MEELIKDIFTYHDFDVHEFDFGKLYFFPKDSIIKYYWLAVHVDSLESILELQNEWFDTSREFVNDKDFDKNTSLLVLVEREESELQRKQILKLEEDPFQFKKLVLTYTPQVLNELQSHSDSGSPEKLLELVTNDEVFTYYKENHSEYSWHHLLYNLTHKLSFLKINVDIDQNLTDLQSKSTENISELGLDQFYGRMEKIFTPEILEDLENMTVDNLIELFEDEITD